MTFSSIPLEQWVVYVAIAIMGGIVGQMLTGRSKGGFAIAAVLGLVCAFVAQYAARSQGAPEPLAITISGHSIPVLWPIVGATVAALAVGLFRHRSSRGRGR